MLGSSNPSNRSTNFLLLPPTYNFLALHISFSSLLLIFINSSLVFPIFIITQTITTTTNRTSRYCRSFTRKRDQLVIPYKVLSVLDDKNMEAPGDACHVCPCPMPRAPLPCPGPDSCSCRHRALLPTLAEFRVMQWQYGWKGPGPRGLGPGRPRGMSHEA